MRMEVSLNSALYDESNATRMQCKDKLLHGTELGTRRIRAEQKLVFSPTWVRKQQKGIQQYQCSWQRHRKRNLDRPQCGTI